MFYKYLAKYTWDTISDSQPIWKQKTTGLSFKANGFGSHIRDTLEDFSSKFGWIYPYFHREVGEINQFTTKSWGLCGLQLEFVKLKTVTLTQPRFWLTFNFFVPQKRVLPDLSLYLRVVVLDLFFRPFGTGPKSRAPKAGLLVTIMVGFIDGAKYCRIQNSTLNTLAKLDPKHWGQHAALCS